MRISVNIVFKNHCMLIVTCMISHDKILKEMSIKRVSNMSQFGMDLHSSRLL